MSVVFEQRGKLWVYGYCAFILKILDLDVETLYLSIKLTMSAGKANDIIRNKD